MVESTFAFCYCVQVCNVITCFFGLIGSFRGRTSTHVLVANDESGNNVMEVSNPINWGVCGFFPVGQQF